MTRNEVAAQLKALISGRLTAPPDSWRVDEDHDGNLTLEAGGERFEITVARARHEFDAVFAGSSREELATLARSIDEAEEEADRDGPASPDHLRRMLDEAIERGIVMRGGGRETIE